jgi:hypothetical protein
MTSYKTLDRKKSKQIYLKMEREKVRRDNNYLDNLADEP